MKYAIKLFSILVCVNLLTSCGTLPGQAYVAVNCPEHNRELNYSTTETGSVVQERSTSSSRTHDDGLAHNKFFISYRVGVGTEKAINDKWAFQPAILVSGKGNKTESNGFEEKISMTYIDIPLLMDYKLGQSKFSINGGFQPSFLLNAKQKITFQDNESSEKVTDQFNTFDLAAIVGAGYQVTDKIRFNIGYDLGLTNIYKSSDEFGSAFKAQNRMLRLTLSYKL